MNDHDIQGPPVEPARPRLLDLARETIRRRHYRYRTEQAYLHWLKRFLLLPGKRHPRVLISVGLLLGILSTPDFCSPASRCAAVVGGHGQVGQALQ